MWTSWTTPSIFYKVIQLLGLTVTSLASSQNQSYPHCKSIPGSHGWPSIESWARLNSSLSGRLIAPSPPGAVCHQGQPTYDPSLCPVIAENWTSSAWQSGNPVGAVIDNFNNDTCLPNPKVTCSGAGYPIYVINATCAEDVKRGVDFARRHDIRLIVKGTGHDYLGRSSAPNSLSIWTHHISGLSFQDGFQPQGCKFTIDGPSVTAAAGTQMREIDYEAHLRNLTIVGGGSGTVGVGGYFTGGGHSALSSTYGLAADQVLEMEIVTPGGEILTINECQNTDLFWAMRGGGGSTFGVITSLTFKAFQSMPFVIVNGGLIFPPGTDFFWEAIANIISQSPALDDLGIMAYFFTARNVSEQYGFPFPIDGFLGTFMLPVLHPDNTTDSLNTTVWNILKQATAGSPVPFTTIIEPELYPDFWAWYSVNNGPLIAGYDQYAGSRLLDRKALTQNVTALAAAFKTATAFGTTTIAYLVGGHGVMNAKPRGGSNAVNSAWRTAYVHSVVAAQWQPLDEAAEKEQMHLLNDVYVEALRQLAPDTGAYINEAYTYEPNFQKTFWGINYPRLLEIKRKVDPHDVFWCQPCVGNERWEVIGDMLCKI